MKLNKNQITHRFAIAAFVMVASISFVQAQEPGFGPEGGPGMQGGPQGGPQGGFRMGPPPAQGPGILLIREVQTELKLKSDQIEKLREILRPVRPQGRPGDDRPEGGPDGMPGRGQGGRPEGGPEGRPEGGPEGRPQGRPNPEEAQKKDEQIKKVLSASQFKRYTQISLQVQGAAGVLRPDVAKKLNLSDDQREEIEAILEKNRPNGRRGGMQGGPDGGPRGGDDFQGRPEGGPRAMGFQGGQGAPQGRPGMGPQGDAQRKKVDTAILAVLTSEQKATWKTLLGEPFKLPRQGGPQGRPEGGPNGRPPMGGPGGPEGGPEGDPDGGDFGPEMPR